MAQRILIEPVTRIEGHAKITIDLDGSSFTIPVVGGKGKLQAALGAVTPH